MASGRNRLLVESATLSRVVQSKEVRYRFTAHARQEMANDSIQEHDVRHVLARNGVWWVEWKKDELWHVEGDDIDGRSIRVVMTVRKAESLIKIITVMAL